MTSFVPRLCVVGSQLTRRANVDRQLGPRAKLNPKHNTRLVVLKVKGWNWDFGESWRMKSPIPPGFKASCVRGCLFVGIHTAGLAFWKRKLEPLPCKVSIIFKLLVPHNADLSRKGTACYYCIWLFFAHCRKILERVRTRAKSMSYQQKKKACSDRRRSEGQSAACSIVV
jgi:hypothetical protein